MTPKFGNYLAGVLLATLSLTEQVLSKEKTRPWQTGQLIGTEVSGHGRESSRGRRSRIWWTYRIDAGTQIYSAVSRDGPGKTRLSVNASVKFAPATDRLYIVNNQGKEQVLRLLRTEVKTSEKK